MAKAKLLPSRPIPPVIPVPMARPRKFPLDSATANALEHLVRMHERGLMTDYAFASEKAQLLSNYAAISPS